VVFHSDGDIRMILPSLISEGVNAIQPLDALAGMDVLELKEQFGDRLAFMGNVPNKSVLPRGTPGDIAACVREKLMAGMGGGYILDSSHSIAGDVPPSNFEAMLEAGRKYGRYPLRD
jgi:uroporphyrinogen decarboxylase